MTPDWTHSVDVDRLAAAHAAHDFSFALADMPRLREQLLSPEGLASGRVQWGRERGLTIAMLSVQATPRLQCQRCLRALDVPVNSSARIALVDELVPDEALPEAAEAYLITGRRLLLRELVEEEILLGMPLIARHADAHCEQTVADLESVDAPPGQPTVAVTATKAPEAETTHKPFAGLGELLRRR